MNDQPIKVLVEQVDRQTAAIRDMMDAHATQGRLLVGALDGLRKRVLGLEQRMLDLEPQVACIRNDLRDLHGEIALIEGRMEGAVSRAIKARPRRDVIGISDERPPRPS